MVKCVRFFGFWAKVVQTAHWVGEVVLNSFWCTVDHISLLSALWLLHVCAVVLSRAWNGHCGTWRSWSQVSVALYGHAVTQVADTVLYGKW